MSITWLHISDFHIRGGDPYDRDVVLKALVRSVRDFRETKGRKPDLIFATGDIAYSGKAAEYLPATKFFDALLDAAELEKSHLFVVPGNHDVDRDQAVGLSRTLETETESVAYFKTGHPKAHISQKLGAFRDWYDLYFDGIRKLCDNTTCDVLPVVNIRGVRIAVLQLNTALFSLGGDEDYHKLVLGRRPLMLALEEMQKLDVDLKIGLLHHPLDLLADFELGNIKSGLQETLDILLRGHLHVTEVESVISVAGTITNIGAGAAYQTRKWPNRALYCHYADNCVRVFPVRYEDQTTEVWTVDPSVFPHEEGYEKSFPVARTAFSGPTPTPSLPKPVTVPVSPHAFRSNIPSRGDLPIVGRDALLEEMTATLCNFSEECVLVLYGASGTGKSELAREYARRNQTCYPGGTFFIRAGAGSGLVDLARIGSNVLGIEYPEGLSLQHQCERTLLSFGSAPVLLIYDNVLNEDELTPWLPPAGMSCHVLVTTVNEHWTAHWKMLPVPPLEPDDAIELIERLGGHTVRMVHGDKLVQLAQGLPIQIVPATRVLAYEERRGRINTAVLQMTEEAQDSFRYVYQALDDPVRIVLHAAAYLNSDRIVRTELFSHLATLCNDNKAEFERRLDVCLDFHLLENTGDLRMHQLLAIYLKGVTLSPELSEQLAQIRIRQKERFLELAKAVNEHPADREHVAAFLSYDLTGESWDNGKFITGKESELVGQALIEIGRFDEARPWFECAVAEAEQGDVHGRINHASLGSSLHQVGYCYASTGKFDEAQPWFERAVAEAEQGDVHGRIDHESLGSSLHMVGDCYASTGKFDEARPWFERAVAEAEQGDVHGRIDHASLGRSLHQVGYCYSRTGKFDEARPWFERAVTEKEQGDVHVRIDHASLGRSLHQVGYCYASTGKFDEARPWVERAVAEAEQGDVHGRIDHASLGRSLHQVGYCYSRTGKFDEARPWFERAVTEKEQGDVHVRIDHASLGRSLHQVGYCYASTGKFDEARPWVERAVAEAEQGDVHGRIDHASLGRSLHMVGDCYARTGKFDEARPWSERAVAEAEQGDVHGRIDHASLGRSLHMVGDCYASTGKFDEARPWYERAVAEAEQGDVHGRIDHASLGSSLRAVAVCLRKIGKPEEAQQWDDAANSIQ